MGQKKKTEKMHTPDFDCWRMKWSKTWNHENSCYDHKFNLSGSLDQDLHIVAWKL